jgi:hypothetical protein
MVLRRFILLAMKVCCDLKSFLEGYAEIAVQTTGALSVVKALVLEGHANVEARNHAGAAPIHIAASNGESVWSDQEDCSGLMVSSSFLFLIPSCQVALK